MASALSNYISFAVGLTELTRAKATELAKSMLEDPMAGPAVVAGQASALAEDLMSAARSNREAITTIVQAEVAMSVASSSPT